MTEAIRIKCNRSGGYMTARPMDAIYLTYPGDRHTPVCRGGICGTITCRPGEIGVYLGRRRRINDSD